MRGRNASENDASEAGSGGLTFAGPSFHRWTPTSKPTSERFARTGRRDTKPEVALRRTLHARGLRFRVDRLVLRGLRRRADLVFGPARVAVFVDGCFWHGCPTHGTWPKNNADFWREKIETNRLRDRDTDRRLIEAGWKVVRVWEHEDVSEVADRLERIVRDLRGR